jgi:hypothetical protein
MKKHNARLTSIVFLCLISICASASAQDKSGEKSSSKPQASKTVRKGADEINKKAETSVRAAATTGDAAKADEKEQALQIINSVIWESDKIEDIKDQVYIKGRAAGLLWNENREKAQAEFLKVAEIIEGFTSDKFTAEQIKWMRDRLWQELIQEAFRHDRNLAERLQGLKASKEKERNQQRGEANDSMIDILKERAARADVLAQMAMEALQQHNPRQACSLLKESLATGIASPAIANLLVPLKNSLGRSQVDPLFEQYLLLLTQRPTLPVSLFSPLMVYIFPDLQAGAGKKAAAEVEAAPHIVQEFFALLLATLSQLSKRLESSEVSAQSIQMVSTQAYALALWIQPKIAQYAPDKLEQFASIIEQIGQKLPSQQRQHVQISIGSRSDADITDMIRLAEKEMLESRRNIYYARAAQLALASGNYKVALELVDKINDVDLRRKLEQEVSFAIVSVYIQEGSFEDAISTAQRLDASPRASALALIARAIAAKGELLRAKSLLAIAEQAALRLDDSIEKVLKLTEICSAYLTIEPEQAFNLLSAIVISANKSFDNDGKAVRMSAAEPDSKIKLPDADVAVSRLVYFDEIFESLAARDYLRAATLAQMLARAELRLSAQLAVCRGIIKSGRFSLKPN